MKRMCLQTLVLVSVVMLMVQCAPAPKEVKEAMRVVKPVLMEHQTFKVSPQGVLVCGAGSKKSSSYQYEVALKDLDLVGIEIKGASAVKVWTFGREPKVTLRDLHNGTSEKTNFVIINTKFDVDRAPVAQAIQQLISSYGGVAGVPQPVVERPPRGDRAERIRVNQELAQKAAEKVEQKKNQKKGTSGN